jgi:hypothetical protein
MSKPQTIKDIVAIRRAKTALLRWLAKHGIGDPLNQLIYYQAGRGKEVLPYGTRKNC